MASDLGLRFFAFVCPINRTLELYGSMYFTLLREHCNGIFQPSKCRPSANALQCTVPTTTSCADPEGKTGGPHTPPEKSQKYRVS